MHELADESEPKSGRLATKQKLKGFLYFVGSKASDVTAGLLQTYAENKLGV